MSVPIIYWIVLICIIAFILSYTFPVVKIVGDSMYPTYHDSEYVIGCRIYSRHHLTKGKVIVYRSPDDATRNVVKRIDNTLKDFNKLYLYCLGDNAEVSHDSRSYGYVSEDNIVCVLIRSRRRVTQ